MLGSLQHIDEVDEVECSSRNVAIAKRRCGGGSVYCDPERFLWVDFIISSTDTLWSDDVAKAALWVGEVWRKVLIQFGLDEATVFTGKSSRDYFSKKLCYAGIGAGEVTLGGRKIVGISQRRTRDFAIFSTGMLIDYDSKSHCEMMKLSMEDREMALSRLTRNSVSLYELSDCTGQLSKPGPICDFSRLQDHTGQLSEPGPICDFSRLQDQLWKELVQILHLT